MKPFLSLLLFGLFALSTGCTLIGKMSDAPEIEDPEVKQDEATSLEDDVLRIGDVARVFDLNSVKVEGVGLVMKLDGTGSDPALSAWHQILLEEMKKRDVADPNKVLASPDTSLVLIRGYLRPGISKGDPFDVEVFLPDGSATTSLKGGWLMEAHLSEGATVAGHVMTGRTYAKASGPVMVGPTSEGDEGKNDNAQLRRGRVLGGGASLTARTLSMIMLKEHQTGPEVIRVGERINRRFSAYGHGAKQKEGLATPKTNKYIELQVSPRYKHNLPRYLEVIQSLALEERPSQKEQNLAILEEMLGHPTTARRASLRLEGIGADGIRVLKRVLENPDPEVRFYAAEALAYLGDPACARTLQETARDEPALRVWALTALASLDEAISHQMLVELMDGTSAETRYGAFRALWAMDPRDPFLRSENVGGRFHLHELDTQGVPMIHLTRSFRPEVVLFGRDQEFLPPLMLKVGKHILVVANTEDDQVKISRFAIDEEDQKVECSRKVSDVIRNVVKLGATYPDVVSILLQADQRHNLLARVAVDALPEGGRVLVRDRREVPETRPGLFPTEYVSESPDSTGPAPEKKADSTATDFGILSNEDSGS